MSTPEHSQGRNFPNQKFGWVLEPDGTWSLYSETGVKLISTTTSAVTIPSLPGGSISVTDGTTTVSPASVVDFTSNATVTRSGTTAEVAVSGGGSQPGFPADTTGVTTPTVTPDPISGENSMKVITVPQDQAIIAVQIEGDAYPRLIITADPTDYGAILMGDGTFDPTTSAGALIGYFGGAAGLTIDPGSANGGKTKIGRSGGATQILGTTFEIGALSIDGGILQDDLPFATGGQGPVLVDQSDGHTYRIISTAGVLSTVQVT